MNLRELFVSHISFPPSLTEGDNFKIATNDYIVLPKRPAEAYKGAMEMFFLLRSG